MIASAFNLIMLPMMGLITSLIFGGMKKVSDWLSIQSAIVKQVIVLIVAGVVYLVAKYLNVGLPDDPRTWTDGAINTFITAMIAFGFKAIQKAIAAKNLPS